MLDKLDQARIVRPVPAPPGQDPMRFRRYEIFHDVLAPAINRESPRARTGAAPGGCGGCPRLAVGLLIVSVVLSGVFFYLWRNSVRERQIALSRQMAAVANGELTVDPDTSALLAQQALSLYDTSQAEEAMRAALPDIQEIADVSNRHDGFRSGVRSRSTRTRSRAPGRMATRGSGTSRPASAWACGRRVAPVRWAPPTP